MSQQISREIFETALTELGHDPGDYRGKRLSLSQMSELYDLEQDIILDAVDQCLVSVHYDYQKDVIWVDALEAAHFFYCLKSNSALFSGTLIQD